jgi:cystathionine beta-lyase/cystathionine gamma-synthase
MDCGILENSGAFADFCILVDLRTRIHLCSHAKSPTTNFKTLLLHDYVERARLIHIAKPIIGEEEKRAVMDVLESGQISPGKKVEEFEHAFASYIGAKHAIATSSGTTAIKAILMAYKIWRRGNRALADFWRDRKPSFVLRR